MTTESISGIVELNDNQSTPPLPSAPSSEQGAPTPTADVEGEDSIIEISCDSSEGHGRIPSDESFDLPNHHDLSPIVSPSTSYLNTRRSSTSSLLDKKLDSGNGQPDTPTRPSRRRSSTLVTSPGSPEVRRSIDSNAASEEGDNSSGEEVIASLNLQPHPISSLRTTARIANQSRQIFRPAAIVPRLPPLRSKNSAYPTLGHRASTSTISRSAVPPLSPIPDSAEPNLDPTAHTFQPFAAASPFADATSYDTIVENGKNSIGDLTKSAREALSKRGLKPIPALHGPLTLPYARCPSGIDAFLFSPEKDVDPWTFVMEPDDVNRKAPNRRHVSVPLPGNARYSQPSQIKSGRIPGLEGGNRIVSAPAALNKGKFVDRERNFSGQGYRHDAGSDSHSQQTAHETQGAYRPSSNFSSNDVADHGRDNNRGADPAIESFAAVKAAAYAAGFGQGMGEMQGQHFGGFPSQGLPPWPTAFPYSFYPTPVYPPYPPPQLYVNQFAEMSHNYDPSQSLDSSPYFDSAIVSIGPGPGMASMRPEVAQQYAQGHGSEEESGSRSDHEHDGFYFPSPPQRRSRRTATVKPSHKSSVPQYTHRNRSADPHAHSNSRRPSIPYAPAPPLPNHIVPHSPERRYSAAPAILHGPRKNQQPSIPIPTITFIKPSPRRMSVATTGMRRGLDLLDEMSMQHHQEKAKKQQLSADGGSSETSSTSTAIRMPRGPSPASSVGSGGTKSRQHSRSNSATSAGKGVSGRSGSSSFTGGDTGVSHAAGRSGANETGEQEEGDSSKSSSWNAGGTQRNSGRSGGSWRSRGKPRTPAVAQ